MAIPAFVDGFFCETPWVFSMVHPSPGGDFGPSQDLLFRRLGADGFSKLLDEAEAETLGLLGGELPTNRLGGLC